MKAIAFVGLSIIASCCLSKKGRQVAGGPCSYKTSNNPAIVIFIDSARADMANVWCSITNPQSDTVDYYHTNNNYTTLTAIRQEKLKFGDTIIYEHRQITDGACNPNVFRLLLKQEANKNQ